MDTVIAQSSGKAWHLYNGDSCEVIQTIPSEVIGLSVFSPPFASLYTYSASDRDLGNCKSMDEFMDHFSFIVGELYRITMPGRICAVHCMDLPASKQFHGYIGLQDFPGELIRAFTHEDWIFHSRVTIWKDPVTAMQRTKALGLLHKQIKKDSCMSRQCCPDYLIAFRKPGENPRPVTHTNETFPVERWQRYASPVWVSLKGTDDRGFAIAVNPGKNVDDQCGIDSGDTLQRESAREHEDERHICPLQLQVIERAVELWSNPGDTVFSPFAGIGSEGYQSLLMKRKFVGIELKGSYYDQARLNLAHAEGRADEPELFAMTKEEQ